METGSKKQLFCRIATVFQSVWKAGEACCLGLHIEETREYFINYNSKSKISVSRSRSNFLSLFFKRKSCPISVLGKESDVINDSNFWLQFCANSLFTTVRSIVTDVSLLTKIVWSEHI